MAGNGESLGLSLEVNNKRYGINNQVADKTLKAGQPGFPYSTTVTCKNIDIEKGELLTVISLFKGLVHEESVRNTLDIEVKYLN